MNKKIIASFIISFFVMASYAQVSLKKGMVIRKTTKVKKALYLIDAYDSLNKGAIIIEGNNIVVDFSNATLKGSNGKTRPDEFFGVAIIVKKGKNITIKNLIAKGYKLALLARNIEGLKIENCDFSYNYRPNLRDESEPQFLLGYRSYSFNENDDALSYGAAMYLKQCNKAIVKNCQVTSGQNALLLTECNGGMFYNNDFSFNTLFGIAMYRCNDNKVLYNKLNFNVRTFQFSGVDDGLQSSSGILAFDQCNNNTFYKNSATHCGNGFFVHGNLSAKDSSEYASVGNKVWSNDFSYSADAGVKTAFSSSHMYDNRFFECERGIWSDNSFNTTIANNKFRDSDVAIESINGQHNEIEDNIFLSDKEAIRLKILWAGPVKREDVKSVDYTIHLNSFNQHPLVYNFTNTDSIRIYNNRYSFVDEIFKIDSTVTNIDSLPFESVDTAIGFPFVKDAIDPFKGNGKFAGRDKIMITEWGPYDFRYPFIWNTNPVDSSGELRFDILGPKGRWKIVSMKGVEMGKMVADTFPGKLTVQKMQAEKVDIEIIAEYLGPSFTDAFGNKIPANKPHRFSFKKP